MPSASQFTIDMTGPSRDQPRLVARTVLDAAAFRAIARVLGARPQRARKTALIAARQAIAREPIETHWNGSETTNTAEPGDWIVTSLSAHGQVLRDDAGNTNRYVIKAAAFPTLYRPVEGENDFGRFHAASSTVEVLHLPGGFDIVGPWGTRQTAPDGYLILNGSEVYGNNVETFAATYAIVG